MSVLALVTEEGLEPISSVTPSRILGLDLSLAATGLTVLVDGESVVQKLLRAGDRREAERLDWLASQILMVVEEQGVQLVAIEGYSYNSRQGGHQLGELGGAVRLMLYRAGIPYETVPPGAWRKQLCGTGNMAKDLVRLELFKRYQIEFTSLDVLEAWAVATSAWRRAQGLDGPAPKRRKKVGRPRKGEREGTS